MRGVTRPSLAFVAALLVLGPGCALPEDHDGPAPQCVETSDCEAGKVCDQGICFGNPPELSLAVEIHPPAERSDLVRTQIPVLDIASDGWTSPLVCEPGVTIQGDVVWAEDSDTQFAASLVFRRPAVFAGGPDAVFTADAVPGRNEGGPSYRLRLPPTTALGDDHYEVSVHPDDGKLFAQDMPPATQVPPARFFLPLPEDTTHDFELGDPAGTKTVSGRVVNAVGTGVSGLVVRAFGRFEPGDPLEVCSNVGTTGSSGRFTLKLPVSWQDEFELRIAALDNPALPSVVLGGIVVPDADPPEPSGVVARELDDVRLPSYPLPISFLLPVLGMSASGGTEPVVGAEIVARTVLRSEDGQVITHRTTAVVEADGLARLALIPAGDGENRSYSVDVRPLAGEGHASTWEIPLEVGPTPGTLAAVLVGRRVLVTGTLLDATGAAAAGVPVRVLPAATLLAALTPTERDRLPQLFFPETITESEGLFGVYVDPSVFGHPAAYDVEFAPPSSSLRPQWAVEDLNVTPETLGPFAAVSMGTVSLPPASYARGVVRDAAGEPIKGAEVRVYVVPDQAAICRETGPSSLVATCLRSAQLRAITRSDADGAFVLVLPAR